MADVFINRGSKTIGPVSSQKLRALVASGKVRQTDQIGRSENGPWQPAGDVQGLFPDPVSANERVRPPSSAAAGRGWLTTTKLFVISGVVITGIVITGVAVLFSDGPDDTAPITGVSESVTSQETTPDKTPNGTVELANENPKPANNSTPVPAKTTSDSQSAPDRLQVLKRLEELGVERIELPPIPAGRGTPVTLMKVPSNLVEFKTATPGQSKQNLLFEIMVPFSPPAAIGQLKEELEKEDTRKVVGRFYDFRGRFRWQNERTLNLNRLKRSAADLVTLQPHFANLRALNISYNEDMGNAALETVAKFPELGVLKLDSTKITDDGLMHLQNLSQVVYLSLRRNDLNGSGLKSLRRMSQLQVLDLEHNNIDGSTLGGLKGFPKLKFLIVSGNGLKKHPIADADLEHLAEIGSLEVLLLSDTEITDVGLQHLARLTSLGTLGIGSNKITDAGLLHLRGLNNLQTLDLSKTQTTDAGLLHLRGLKNLKAVNLTDSQVTVAGVAELKKTLPDLNVIGP